MESVHAVSIASNIWVGCPKPNSEASLRLFCFPYAGAGSSIFHSWANLFPPEMELNLIHLPGRDKRIREPLHVHLSRLIESLTKALYSRLDRPFAFFGHSMGSLISFEVARQLRRQYALQPAHLFVSARQPPHLPDPHADIYKLPEGDFLRAAEDLYSALPDVVTQDAEVLKLFLSIMRADLTMLGTYQYIHEPPLDCPITVFGGLQDKSVTEDELRAWREQTAASFNLTMFPGDHLFIQSTRTAIAQDITRNLSRFWRN